MIQTWALLVDAYRDLNAKRLFWVVLAVSGLVVAAFAALGLDHGSVTLLGWTTPVHSPLLAFITPAVFYKRAFVTFGVDVWLSWLASILALVSTAGIFPDLMAGGSIDLYLSKPIGRVRLFLTKVAGGLLFVTLQVTVFCGCCFVLLRARGGQWEPGVFLAVPLVVLMFSYLFAVCVLLGVVTRSTVAALLLTLVFWAIAWGVQRSDDLVDLGRRCTSSGWTGWTGTSARPKPSWPGGRRRRRRPPMPAGLGVGRGCRTCSAAATARGPAANWKWS